MNTALEVDIYGNANSTHTFGTTMMNGIGGSGDFSRNSGLVVFLTPAAAKKGAISRVVPHVTHSDHTEHEIHIIVTDQGLADLRGLDPMEKVPVIIENCANPTTRADVVITTAPRRRWRHIPCSRTWATAGTAYNETGTMKPEGLPEKRVSGIGTRVRTIDKKSGAARAPLSF
jgi:acyl-CoA hydrolase